MDDALAVTDPAALSALRMTSALTVEAWIRPSGPGQTVVFLNKEGEYELGLLGGELGWTIAYPGGWAWTRTGAHPPVGEWTHVAVAYDGSAVRTFVNGEPAHWKEAAGTIGDAHTNADQLRIGGRQLFGDAFEGEIDAVRVWRRALNQADVRLGLAGPAQTQDPAFVAGWDFSDATGNVLRDAGPGGFDLALDTLGSARAPTPSNGDRHTQAGALLFDGVDDHVAVTEPDALDQLEMLDALTLEEWIYPTGSGSGALGTIVDKEGEYALARAGDGSLSFRPGGASTATTAVAPDRVWSHVALVYDGVAGTADVYLNGALADSRSAATVLHDASPTQNQLRIGGRQSDDASGSLGEHFQGLIDEVRVWGTVRTAAQIAASFDRAVAPDALGLFGYWRFDEVETGAAFDSSAAYHHGVLGSGRSVQAPARTEATAFFGYPFSAAAPALDADGDGIADDRDNCSQVPNAQQQDLDADRFGDDCDFDGDGACSLSDFNLFLPGFQASLPGPSGWAP